MALRLFVESRRSRLVPLWGNEYADVLFSCPFRPRATSVVALRTAVLPEAQTGYGLSVNME
ncbi:MAG: hypothetical protein IJE18_02725 [Bacteroidaceae bacterium]|nr:hypothetical protein [Bacteroidaceae bacterium]